MSQMKYCPLCSAALIKKDINDRTYLACSSEHCDYVFWDNPTFDNLIEKGRATPPSPERYAFFTEAFELVMDEVPIITLYAPNIVEACSSTIKNFYPSHDGRVNLHRVDID